uniref:Uncharacterized protein n=1 Tax=Haemonchus contortus TaxID=6289 RepID=A0A7I4Y8T7_HAECO
MQSQCKVGSELTETDFLHAYLAMQRDSIGCNGVYKEWRLPAPNFVQTKRGREGRRAHVLHARRGNSLTTTIDNGLSCSQREDGSRDQRPREVTTSDGDDHKQWQIILAEKLLGITDHGRQQHPDWQQPGRLFP